METIYNTLKKNAKYNFFSLLKYYIIKMKIVLYEEVFQGFIIPIYMKVFKKPSKFYF